MAIPRNRGDGRPQASPAARRRPGRGGRGPQDGPRSGGAGAVSERLQGRVAWGVGAALILIIFGVLAAGYYQKFYKPPRVWAGSVRDAEFNMGDLVQRIRVLQGVTGQVNLSTVPLEYLQHMLNAEILRQSAPGLGIQITEQDVDQALRQRFYPKPSSGQQTDPGQLDQEFREQYVDFRTRTGLSSKEFQLLLEEELQVQSLAALLGRTIPDTLPHVEVGWIRLELSTGVSADQVMEMLKSKDFATVAQTFNVSDEYADPSGHVGWVPSGAFPDLDGLLFGDERSEAKALALGEISTPVVTRGGIYIVQKLAGPETRELVDPMRIKVNVEMVRQWQEEQRTRGAEEGWVRVNFSSKWYDWVADQVFVSAPRNRPEQR